MRFPLLLLGVRHVCVIGSTAKLPASRTGQGGTQPLIKQFSLRLSFNGCPENRTALRPVCHKPTPKVSTFA